MLFSLSVLGTALLKHDGFYGEGNPITMLLGIASVVLIDRSINKIRAMIRPIRAFPTDGAQHVK